MKFGRLLARLFIGGMFIGHGTQKWFGWFGGPGIEKTSGMMESLGLAPARTNAHAASASETLGGIGIALGAFTPLGPGALSVDGAFGLEETGTGVALAALAAGVLGSTVSPAAGQGRPPEGRRRGTDAVRFVTISNRIAPEVDQL